MSKLTEKQKKNFLIIGIILLLIILFVRPTLFSLFVSPEKYLFITTNYWNSWASPCRGTTCAGDSNNYNYPIKCEVEKNQFCKPGGMSDNPIFYNYNIKISGTCYGAGAKNYYIQELNNNLKSEVFNTDQPLTKLIYVYEAQICTEGNNCPERTRLVIKPCLTWLDSSSRVEGYKLEVYQDKLDITIDELKQYFFTGEQVNIDMKVKNNFGSFIGDICVRTSIDSLLGELKKEYCTGKQEIGLGEKEISITLPVKEVATQQVKLIPIIYIYSSQGKIKNVNVEVVIKEKFYLLNSNSNDIGHWSFYIGEFQGDKKTITINPKPIYINQTLDCNSISCPTGYQCESESGLCISREIIENKLTCMQIGCPVVGGHEYFCTSSGLCAETIFIPQGCNENISCPIGTTCDKESGLCIKSEIINYIRNCVIDSDCVIPCEGITAECTNNICNYQGSCKPIEVSCEQLGCPEGYKCENKVCVSKKPIIKTNYIIISAIVGFVLFIALLIFIYLKLKK